MFIWMLFTRMFTKIAQWLLQYEGFRRQQFSQQEGAPYGMPCAEGLMLSMTIS